MSKYIILFFFIWGCSSEEAAETTCVVDAECDPGLVCREKICIEITQTECEVGKPSCPTGFQCIAEKCSKIPGDADMGTLDQGSKNDPDVSMFDGSTDVIPPTVLSIDPPNGSTNTALDVTVTITFSETLHPPTVSKSNIQLLDSSDRVVETTLTFTPGSTTVILKPTNELKPATGYRIVLSEFVRDIGFNQLERTSSSFITKFEEDPAIRALAEKYAPTIYQSLGTLSAGLRNIDIPTTIEFDGNQNASDNLESALNPNLNSKAAIYYNVITTESTIFIFYMLYYPVFKNGDKRNEHSTTGYISVVDKASKKLLFAEGLKIQQSGTDSIISYKPDDSNVGVVNPPPFMRSFPKANQEEDHYPLFITPGTHEPCNFFQEGPQLPIACRHNRGEFMNDDTSKGLVLRAGVAQDYTQASDNAAGYKEMTYGLVSLVEGIWSKRSFVGPESLFSSRGTYKPAGMMRPGSAATGTVIAVPNSLSSDDIDNFGKLPFRWLPAPAQQNHGQWFLDPAFIFSTRYKRLPDPFSLDYCIHPFFGIDRSGDAKCQ